jgi:hypothetical protein
MVLQGIALYLESLPQGFTFSINSLRLLSITRCIQIIQHM